MGTARRAADTLFGGSVVALGLFIVVETARMTVGPTHAMVGPRLFPLLIATGLVLVGLVLLREALAGTSAHGDGMALDGRAVALVGGGLLLQILLIERAGWMIAATLLFLAATAAFGSRRIVVDAALGLALSAVAFLCFNYGLGLDLPTGTWVEGLLAPAGGEPP